MATTAKYLFTNSDISDSSGNGRDGSIVGAGPGFYSVGPGPIAGGKFIKDCTDANYVSLPTSVYTGITTTGTIKISVFNSDQSKVFISSNHGVKGNFFAYFQSGTIAIRVPTAGGSSQFETGATGIQTGVWYTIFFHWSPGSFKVDIKNTLTGVTNNILDQNVTADFGACSAVMVGRDTIVGGFSFGSSISNIEYLDTDTTTDSESYNKQSYIANFGHSYVYSAEWRTYWQAYIDNTLAVKNYLLVGQTANGSTITPFTDGVNGYKIANIDSIITDKLNLDFPAFDATNNYMVFVGPVEYNDAENGTLESAYKTSYRSVIDKITVISSNIKIMMVTNPDTPNAIPVDTYTAYTRQVYADALNDGLNVYLADWALHPPFDWNPDNVHPSTLGYQYMGEYLAQSMYDIFNPVSPIKYLGGIYLIKTNN